MPRRRSNAILWQLLPYTFYVILIIDVEKRKRLWRRRQWWTSTLFRNRLLNTQISADLLYEEDGNKFSYFTRLSAEDFDFILVVYKMTHIKVTHCFVKLRHQLDYLQLLEDFAPLEIHIHRAKVHYRVHTTHILNRTQSLCSDCFIFQHHIT